MAPEPESVGPAKSQPTPQTGPAKDKAKEQTLLQRVIDATHKTAPDAVEDMMRILVAEAKRGTVTWHKNVALTIERGIAKIDAAVSQQLAAIMHHEKFLGLEGTWRGFHHLVYETKTAQDLKIKVLNISKRDLFRDLDRASEFDQSQLFKQVYEQEFGTPGGEPFGALIGDYQFSKHPDDITLLTKMSLVAAGAFCPFISAADPDLLDLDSFAELAKPRDLAKTFESKEYIQWRAFRDADDSRFVVLTMPRVLSRLPYGSATKPVEEFNYEEAELDRQGKPKPLPHDHFAWMNAAYVLGTRLTNAFTKSGWCTAIRGFENGGKVDGLPTFVFKSDEGDLDLKCPSEVGITGRREAELSKLGFLPICHYKNTDYAVFFGAQTAQKPKNYGPKEAAANSNAEISARLPYIMASSRIAHYLKVIARDKIGSFMELSDCQDWLTRWVSDYICADPHPTEAAKREFPLAAAKIQVREVPGKAGSYEAIAWLQPWLQMEELTTSLRMVARIPTLQTG